MTRIQNVDQIVAVLRQRLLASGARRPASAGAPTSEPSAVQALASIEGLDDHQLRRALIQDILAEQLGRHLVNDAGFQQVVERVVGALERDAESASLFARVVSDVRAQAAPG